MTEGELYKEIVATLDAAVKRAEGQLAGMFDASAGSDFAIRRLQSSAAQAVSSLSLFRDYMRQAYLFGGGGGITLGHGSRFTVDGARAEEIVRDRKRMEG
jgi:hypothetical protein